MAADRSSYRGPDRRARVRASRPAYLGPDRRGTARRPRTRTRPWTVAWVVGVAIVVAILFRTDALGLGVALTYQSLRDTGDCLVLLAGSALLVTWALDGRASHAMDGVALGLVGGGQLLLAGPSGTLVHHQPMLETVSPAARLALAVPALLLLARSPVHSIVDSTIRPLRLALHYAALAAVGLLAIGLAASFGSIDNSSLWALVVLVLAVGWTAVGAQRVLRAVTSEAADAAMPRGEVVRREAANKAADGDDERSGWLGWALVAFGAGDLLIVVALLADSPRAAIASAELQAMSGLALAALAASWLVDVLRDRNELAPPIRGEPWQTREILDRTQEARGTLLHDARNLLAGIRIANATLERYADRLDGATGGELREAMASEFSRLETLLDPPTGASVAQPGRRLEVVPETSRGSVSAEAHRSSA